MTPDLAPGGQNLWKNTSLEYGMTIEESYASLKLFIDLGNELGFSFNFSENSQMYNTCKAHQMLMWAETFGKKRELKLAFFEVHFSKGFAMGDELVLAQIAQSVGLDKTQALESLHEEDLLGKKFWQKKNIG